MVNSLAAVFLVLVGIFGRATLTTAAEQLATVFAGMVGILIAIFISAFFLRLSCILYNLLAGAPDTPSGPTLGGEPETDVIGHPEAMADDWAGYEKSMKLPGVPTPTLERAMRIIFFAALVNTTGSFIILRVVRLIGLVAAQGSVRSLSILLFSTPLGILVLGGMIAAMLPTTFGKGVLVSLMYHILVAMLGLAVLFAMMVFGISLSLFG
ncbi:MAG TPA: hypothetical protein VMG10_01745 [Gemmataceae bacterium]|nr:hypothetical protein [Gemmataceae bacterium]